MRCPKCGCPHIRAATCVMCGAIVQRLEPLAVRMCPSCGRKRRFEGMCCVDCAAAVALGAISIKNNLRRAYRDEPLNPGHCPAAEWLERHTIIWDGWARRFRARLRYRYWDADKKVRSLPVAAEWRRKNREKLQEYRMRYLAKPGVRERRRENDRKRKRRPEVMVRENAQRRKRYREDPEVRRKNRERCRAYYHKRRAEMLAAQALENQTEAMGATPDENTVCLRTCAGGADATSAVA